MTAPYPVGSRVVCPDPTGRWFVGTVTHVHTCGDLTVTDGAGFFRATAGEVRPVVPRSSADLAAFGAWWWRNGRPVEVSWVDYWMVWRDERKRAHFVVAPSDDWRGPVQPPPVVRV